MCVIYPGVRRGPSKGGKTDLDDDRGGRVHDDPRGALCGGPLLLVEEGGVGRVEGGVCGRHVDGEVVEHVGPVLALDDGGGEDDIDGGADGDEEGDDAGDLEDIVCACEGPVVLCGEDEVEEEDDGEGECDAGDEDLNGEGLCKGGAVLEDGVVRVRGGVGLCHDKLAEEEDDAEHHHPNRVTFLAEQQQAWLSCGHVQTFTNNGPRVQAP